MNVNLLIDALVQQTTVLIAQLATSDGSRTPLAHTANQVFLDLVSELKRQGLGNKVIADMFGLALRTYHDKVQRLAESNTFRGRSLSSAVLEFVQERRLALRNDILCRFAQDDQRMIRSVLRDLVDSGLLFRSGSGPQTTYKAATAEDSAVAHGDSIERVANLLWVAIHRFGPLSVAQMASHMHVDQAQLTAPLHHLLESRRVAMVDPGSSAVAAYYADECVILLGAEHGWEAAVFDHYQAVVSTILARLRDDGETPDGWQGGSTYTYDVWEGHPCLEEVAGFLSEMRGRAVELRVKVEAHNRTQPPVACTLKRKFIAYVGQSVHENAREKNHENSE